MQAKLSVKEALSPGIVAAMKETIIDTERGRRIRHVRANVVRIRSQAEFAAWIGGVTRGAVGNWERGEPIGYKHLRIIADRAHVPFEWLAEGKGAMPSAPVQRSNQELRESIMALYRQLPPDERIAIASELVLEIHESGAPSQAPLAELDSDD